MAAVSKGPDERGLFAQKYFQMKPIAMDVTISAASMPAVFGGRSTSCITRTNKNEYLQQFGAHTCRAPAICAQIHALDADFNIFINEAFKLLATGRTDSLRSH
ncbi:hypothetical protein [Xanthomonas sp. 3075]|uniref:hypothetical protein n=1 Tax=Xanthomonas sp. 3075 TaxID=3035315 RepID=UPI0016092846|nr:hypothetical protein [Xanthomonas sp. 3075]MBB4130139.1 hypothetical protein [Xanthomonas sp. 3075]